MCFELIKENKKTVRTVPMERSDRLLFGQVSLYAYLLVYLRDGFAKRIIEGAGAFSGPVCGVACGSSPIEQKAWHQR